MTVVTKPTTLRPHTGDVPRRPAVIDAIMSVVVAACVIAVAAAVSVLVGSRVPAAAASPVAETAVSLKGEQMIDAERRAARFEHRFAVPGGNPLGLSEPAR